MGYVPPPLQPVPRPWPDPTVFGDTALKDWKIRMAIYEINKHADSLGEWLFWKYGKGPTIKVKWPVGWTEQDHLGNQIESADPNHHYRPWLEKNVGKQNRDWVWGLRDNNAAENRLTIKFRKSKAQWATMAALLWT